MNADFLDLETFPGSLFSKDSKIQIYFFGLNSRFRFMIYHDSGRTKLFE